MPFVETLGTISQANDVTTYAISAAADGGTNTVTFTCTGHPYLNGDYVDITGTTDYNGAWEVSNVAANTFDVFYPTDPALEELSGGDNGINYTSSQSGTAALGDIDSSGLTGLAGVTVYTIGNITIYDLAASVRMQVYGAWRIDSDYEIVILRNTIRDAFLTVSGSFLELGKRKLENGVIGYSGGTALDVVSSRTGTTHGGIGISGGLRWNGGDTYSESGFLLEDGSTIEINQGKFTLTTSVNTAQFRVKHSSGNAGLVNIYYLQLNSLDVVLSLYLEGGANVGVFDLRRAYFQTAANSAQTFTLENYSVRNNRSPDDMQGFSNAPIDCGTISIRNFDEFPVITCGTSRSEYFKAFRRVQLSFVDLDGAAITGYELYGIDTDNGSRALGATGQDDTADKVYSATGATGTTQFDILWYIWNFEEARTPHEYLDDRRNGSGRIPIKFYKYGFQVTTINPNFFGSGPWINEAAIPPKLTIAEPDKAVVDAYLTIDTPEQFNDRASAFLQDNFSTYNSPIVTLNGSTINAGAFNVTVDATAGSAFAFDGTTITIKSSSFVGSITTTGTITLANGAEIIGAATDTSGTVITNQFSVTNIVAGSRIQLYNATTGSEKYNAVVAGTSLSGTYTEAVEYTTGDDIRVRLTCQSGTTACQWYEATVTASATGWSLRASQIAQADYPTIGIDGSTVTEFALDAGNVQVDSDDPDGLTTKTRLVAWMYFAGTTEVGIRDFFQAITLEDSANAKIDVSVVDLKVDNISARQLQMTDFDFRLYRSDGTSWIQYPSTGGYGIDTNSGKVYVAGGGGSGTSDLSFVDVKRAVRQALSPKDKAVIIKKAR